MPRGVYHHLSADGTVVVESFSCAPGPVGWRYVSRLATPDGAPLGQVDVTCDAAWRQIRVLVESGGWTVRGGVVGPDAVWRRAATSPAPTPYDNLEQSVPAAGFTAASPAFAVATARLLGLDLMERRRIRLVSVSGPASATLAVDEGWALVDVTEHATELRPLRVERYEVADLASAERRVVQIAGDVVVDAPGLELVDLETPPS